MKKGMSLLLMVALLIFNYYTAGAQDSVPKMKLSFEQALGVALQNSHVLKQSQFQVNEKEQAAKAAKGLYLPKVGVTANYMVMSDDVTLDLTPVKNAITPLYSTLANYGSFSASGVDVTALVRQNLNAGLTQLENTNWDETIQKKRFATVAAMAQWPLYTGGKIHAANKAANIEISEADDISKQKQGELISELVERYFGLCLAKQAVKVRQDVFNGMEQHLHDAQKMQKDGFIANAEVLQAQLYDAQADRELKKARRNEDIINQALANTLALENDSSIEPLTELFYLDSIEPVEYFKKLAFEKNPSLLQVDDKKQLAEQNYKIQMSEFMPSIAVQGTYNLWDKDLSPYMPDWIVGVGLKWTIFDGTSRYRKVRSANFKTQQVQEAKEKAESDVGTLINKLYNELNIYREQLSELETARAFAEEYLRVREKAFHEEMSNSTEVVDANLALAQVRIERLQAMYGYDLTLARLLQYAGIPETFTDYRQKNAKTESYKPIQ